MFEVTVRIVLVPIFRKMSVTGSSFLLFGKLFFWSQHLIRRDLVYKQTRIQKMNRLSYKKKKRPVCFDSPVPILQAYYQIQKHSKRLRFNTIKMIGVERTMQFRTCQLELGRVHVWNNCRIEHNSLHLV